MWRRIVKNSLIVDLVHFNFLLKEIILQLKKFLIHFSSSYLYELEFSFTKFNCKKKKKKKEIGEWLLYNEEEIRVSIPQNRKYH